MGRKISERNQEIIHMREEGKTYQEIADLYGISRQRVYNIVYMYLYRKNGDELSKQLDKIIYPNIQMWMKKNNMKICKLSEKINPNITSSVSLTRFLTEPSVKWNIREIQKLLEITGMTFEEAFSSSPLD